ncbi:hypothetical protein Cme02nite_72190 [Catellatospora methionotrophica]|uniref:Uncharacterized protein n=1 Tax=Catellatospora methionotrophica TaxID=121620 RepID=A0A8J3PIX9_9ACTN|nr:hypothetical protein [Catellatospora methionotrophica]GIG18887.1 hypothetical protein Cme02nite_72190 [Catellatospora methionotrophica]
MATRTRAGIDWLALVVALLCLATAGGYVALVVGAGDAPVLWFVAGLLVAAALTLHGSIRSRRFRAPALLASGVLLCALGALALFTIGLPVVAAGLIAFAAAARARVAA